MTTTLAVQDPPRSRRVAFAAPLRDAAIVVLACGVAGIVAGGVGTRLVMRIAALAAPGARGMVTENGNVIGDITLEGTVGLALFTTIGSAVFGAGAYVVLRPWLPGRAFLRGLVFGTFLLLLAGGVVVDPANADFVILGDRALNVTMFSGLFLAFGVVAAGTVAALERRISAVDHVSPRSLVAAALVGLPVLPGIAAVTVGLGLHLGVSLIGARIGVLVARALEHRGMLDLAKVVRLTATVVALVVIVLAGVDYVRAVVTIL